MSSSPSVESVAAVLRGAIERAAGSGPCSVLYSGGLDSTILATAARSARPTLVAVGVDDSHDLHAARTGAERLGQPLVARVLSLEEVRAAVERWAPALHGADRTSRAVTLGLALAMEATPPGVVLCGQGADELFLGYAHFRGLTAAAADARREEDLERLRHFDWPRAERIAGELDRPLRAPFLEPTVVDAVRATDPAAHLPRGVVAKPLLRSVALALGVPEELAQRPKKAFQFGSGLARSLRRLDPPSPGPPELTIR